VLTTILRKEHKNKWERRTCLTPESVKELIQQGFKIDVEKSDKRIFSNQQYQSVGCHLVSSPKNYQFILGIKEPPVSSIQQNQVHLCFSHTHKGQPYNLPLLQKFIDKKSTLIDYELITDDANVRTIAFGRFAGIAGAVDTLGLAGQKYTLQNIDSGLSQISQSWQYQNKKDIKQKFSQLKLTQGNPVRVVIVGSGKVGKGAEEVCQWLGLEKITPEQLLSQQYIPQSFYSVLSSKDLMKEKGKPFNPKSFDYVDYLKMGKEKYESVFSHYLGSFDILLHTPYWEQKYPKLLPLALLQEKENLLPTIIGDISADINGSLACTHKASDTDHPVFSFDVQQNCIKDGLDINKLSVMSIDNLPCELPMDASEHFSSILPQYLPQIMSMDLNNNWQQIALPQPLKKATIVYKGQLTPNFSYLNTHLKS